MSETGGYDTNTETAWSFRVCMRVSVIVWSIACLFTTVIEIIIQMCS